MMMTVMMVMMTVMMTVPVNMMIVKVGHNFFLSLRRVLWVIACNRLTYEHIFMYKCIIVLKKCQTQKKYRTNFVRCG